MRLNMISFVLALFVPSFTQSSPAAEVSVPLRQAVADDYSANLQDLFFHLHANPELSHREFATAQRLGLELRTLGYDVTEGVGGTGLVAVLANGEGPTVIVRADMDALPVEEQSGLSYASTARQVDRTGEDQPVMHACGHDVHMTAMVGAARQMANRRDQWSGTLILIGQPAEEIGEGARAMLDDGLYERFPKPDYALGLHVSSALQSGTIRIPESIVNSSSDSVDIIVHGVGAHGASPHRGIDPILVASQIVVSLQSIVSRNISPLEPGVITVGRIQGGTARNIISDRVEMQLTVRSNSIETRQQLLDSIARVANGVARSLGVPEELLPEVVSVREGTPPTVNDTESANLIRAAFTDHFGAERINDTPRTGMAADDFAHLVTPDTGVKSIFFRVGGTPETEVGSAAANHSPFFKIEPEPAISTGVEALVVAAMTLMPR